MQRGNTSNLRPFTKDHQPTAEQVAKRAATRHLKHKLITDVIGTRIDELCDDKEIKMLHPQYKIKYPKIEDFKKATCYDIAHLSVAKSIIAYDFNTNAKNVYEMLKLLNHMSADDFEENVRPILMLNGVEADV